jgi:Na+/H+-dicarboxylate symporter
MSFARAVWPAQMAAVATRSSLATVPTLMAGGEQELKLDPACTGYVIPLAGSLLKLSRAVTEPVTLLFLAGLLDIPLSLQQVLLFSGGMILLSTGTPGIPRMTSGVRSMPLYVAVGIPPEYVLLLATSAAVTDGLMTVLNSTGYLTAAVLVDRFAAQPLPAALPQPTAPPMVMSTTVPPGPEPKAHPPSPRDSSVSG